MKTLIIIRHGKSSWDHPELKDHLRPLNQRGVNNAFSVADELIRLDVKPSLFLTSPAVRALDTAIILATKMDYPLDKIATDANIYEASVSELLEGISEIGNEHETVLFFGHNPGFTNLINRLQSETLFNLPTCGTFAIELPIDDWSEIACAKGQKCFSLIPKELD
ncbi:MAG: histidine phosphatase family protein [Flavobacteriales bacterium]|jgi:phosphohistidine phosphatase|nr:histidine phosphatase family protein [Flavobacteriales bacterium]